jgi:hypothetical protein
MHDPAEDAKPLLNPTRTLTAPLSGKHVHIYNFHASKIQNVGKYRQLLESLTSIPFGGPIVFRSGKSLTSTL